MSIANIVCYFKTIPKKCYFYQNDTKMESTFLVCTKPEHMHCLNNWRQFVNIWRFLEICKIIRKIFIQWYALVSWLPPHNSNGLIDMHTYEQNNVVHRIDEWACHCNSNIYSEDFAVLHGCHQLFIEENSLLNVVNSKFQAFKVIYCHAMCIHFYTLCPFFVCTFFIQTS